ncbi:MAG: cation:proton antiporter, partial [Firmicutes bacterium]|nr:cation:proton antiporter [Bacillota bacterium]
MEHIDSFIIDLARILIIAGIITVIFRKLKLPAILGYIIAGFLASPNFIPLKITVTTGDVQLWADIGIIFLMFALGLEFSFKKIAQIGGSAVITAMTVMGAMIAIGYTTGMLMGWGKMDSIFLGGMLSMSSTMVIMKVYQEYKMEKERFASVVLGTLVLEDLGGVFMMIILTTLSVGETLQGGAMVGEIARLLGLLVVWLAVGIYLIPTFLKLISKIVNDELLLIISIALCFGMVLIGTRIGFSMALGAFLAGSIIAGTVHAGRIDKLVKPVKDLFGAIFFVSVGTMLDPDMVVKYAVPIIIITVVTIFGQMIFSTLGMLLSGQDLHTAIRGGSGMMQIGEFSFIVASLGTSLGVTGDFLYPIVVCVSVITSFLTPFFIRGSDGTFRFINKRIPSRLKAALGRYTSSQRSSSEEDSDWRNYLKKYFQRVVFCTAGLAAIYIAGTRFIEPLIDQYINADWSHLIAAVVTCGAMIPIIAVLCIRRHILYTKLWIKSRTNRLPLITMDAVKFIISIMAIMITLRKLLHLSYPIIAIIVAVIMVIVVKTDFARSAAIKLEMRFVGNLNEELLARQKREHKVNDRPGWLDQKMYVVEFRINETVENNNIVDFGNNRFFHVT